MDDNRTMAQLLEAPTAGYEDAIVVPEITADNFELKYVRNSRNKPVVAKVSTGTSTPGISSEVAELKDMVKALLLDKKNQSPAPYSCHKGYDASILRITEASERIPNLWLSLIVHHDISISDAVNAQVSASRPNQKASIPFPSRRNDERRREKANDQIEKFYEIFKDLSSNLALRTPAVPLILAEEFLKDQCALIEVTHRVNDPPEVELKDLPPHLQYAFLEGNDKLPVIIAKDLKNEEKAALSRTPFGPQLRREKHFMVKKGIVTWNTNLQSGIEWRALYENLILSSEDKKGARKIWPHRSSVPDLRPLIKINSENKEITETIFLSKNLGYGCSSGSISTHGLHILSQTTLRGSRCQGNVMSNRKQVFSKCQTYFWETLIVQNLSSGSMILAGGIFETTKKLYILEACHMDPPGGHLGYKSHRQPEVSICGAHHRVIISDRGTTFVQWTKFLKGQWGDPKFSALLVGNHYDGRSLGLPYSVQKHPSESSTRTSLYMERHVILRME
ncbi:hypothetical protein Tco_0304675 [Tanacetum coccineum]